MGSNKNYDSLKRQWTLLNSMPHRIKRGTKHFQNILQGAGFDVSLRTVQRDLKELSRHFPLQCDEERISGWKWMEDAPSFGVPGMDPHVALAFKMIDLHLRKMLPESCLNFLKPYNQRASEVLRELNRGGLAKWPKKIARITRHVSLEPPQVNSFVLSTIYDGLLLERQIEITYRNRGSEEAHEGRIHPLGLVFVDNVAYLVCTFWDYEDLRQIALHRIETALLLDETAERPDDFELQTYIDDGHLGLLQSDETIHLKCFFDSTVAKHLEESPINKSQSLTLQKDGRILLEVDVLDTSQLQWWILGFGSQVEVAKPASLREEIAKTCREMNEKYKPNSNHGGETSCK